jgi:hypothetical protein
LQLHQVQLFLPVVVPLFLDRVFLYLFVDVLEGGFFVLSVGHKEIGLVGSIFAVAAFLDGEG